LARGTGQRHRRAPSCRAVWAGALTDTGKAEEALVPFEGVLANRAHRDLHPLALLNLGEFAQQLLEPATRAKVAAAFRARPASRELLGRLVDGRTRIYRLAPLMPWLREQEATPTI
jgi:hypothetical protein